MNTLIFILACVGCTQIICYGKIFEPVRKLFPELLSCPMCVGFWVGFFCCLFAEGLPKICAGYGMLPWGCVSSLCSYGWCMVVGDEGVRVNNNGC